MTKCKVKNNSEHYLIKDDDGNVCQHYSNLKEAISDSIEVAKETAEDYGEGITVKVYKLVHIVSAKIQNSVVIKEISIDIK